MYYIGIDVGGMSIKGGLVDDKGVLLAKESVKTDCVQSSEANVGDIAGLCKRLLEAAGLSENDVAAMGVGVPGTVDGSTGVISYTCNINFRNFNFSKEFKKYYKFPSYVGNDADCAVLGEVKFGGNAGLKNAVIVTLGTGVGTGVLIDGKLLTGNKGAGGEGGHMVIRSGGEKCGCGRRGCWEAYASASALIRDTEKAIRKNPDGIMSKLAEKEGKVSGKTVFNAAKEGDKAAVSLINRYLKFVGEGLVNLGNLLRPEVIFIGGGIGNEGDYIIEKLQKYVNRFSYGGKRNPKILIKKATLKNDAGILGAAALCLK